MFKIFRKKRDKRLRMNIRKKMVARRRKRLVKEEMII